MKHADPVQQTVSPHYLRHRRRLKDAFLAGGLSGFHDYEVLELLITYAIHRKDVKPLAKQLLSQFSSFRNVLDAPVQDIMRIGGIGEHAALLLKLCKAVAEYYLQETAKLSDPIASPADLVRYCRAAMAGCTDEQFRVVYLDAKNRIVADELLFSGTVNQTAVYPRKVMERALHHKAVCIICVHNHPSGSPEPSGQDRQLTTALGQAAATLGITLHDHIIVARHGFFSFHENGLL